MRVLYMSHRYHTNQNTIMKGWVENGHEVCFLSQYAGKIEDYTYVRPIIVGYSAFFRFIDYIYVHILFRKNPYAIDIEGTLHLYDLYDGHLPPSSYTDHPVYFKPGLGQAEKNGSCT